jgi:hypothetical protein
LRRFPIASCLVVLASAGLFVANGHRRVSNEVSYFEGQCFGAQLMLLAADSVSDRGLESVEKTITEFTGRPCRITRPTIIHVRRQGDM